MHTETWDRSIATVSSVQQASPVTTRTMHPVQKPGDCAKLRLRFILHIRQANAATLTVFNNSAITKDRARQDSVMLSKDEAISFVTDVLKLSAAKRKEEPLLFIGELIKAFQVTEPFQSITLIATAPESRHRYINCWLIINYDACK